MQKLSKAARLCALLLGSGTLICGSSVDCAPVGGTAHSGNAPPLRIPVSRKDAAKRPVPVSTVAPAPAKPPSLTLTQQMQHAELKDGFKLVKDVEFAPDRHLTGDFYFPMSDSRKLPAVLLVHGGSWTLGDKRLPGEVDLAQRLAQHGYVAFSADYRLIKDGGIYPKSIKDVRDAFGYMVRNADQLGIDKNRIGIFGASVGGTMAMLAAYAPNTGPLEPILFKNPDAKVKAVVCYAPLTDMRDTELTWVIKYMDDTPWHSPELYAEASPVSYALGACPTMSIHGTDDVTVPFQQSEALIKVLQAGGVEAQLVPIPKVRHVPFHEEAGAVRELGFARLIEFFDKHLKR